jgi:NAD(P)-dependent dehydrogenase (short-subunit alcohol dehydrogenase family)
MAAEAVIVTGAGGALGGALVAELSRGERRVLAVGRGLAQATLDGRYGAGRVMAGALDVTSREGWAALLSGAERDGLAVTGAVLAAGGYRGGEPVAASKDDRALEAMLAANLATAYATLSAILPGMVARKRGSVVVIGSAASVRPWQSAGAAAYAASKAAVVALAQATAAEVHGAGVRVNAILPSTIDSPQNRAGMPDADFSKWVTTASVAAVVSFLLSDASRDVSGAAIPVYGGAGV